jgi:hypothetical protein
MPPEEFTVSSHVPEKPKSASKSKSGSNVAPIRGAAPAVRDHVLDLPAPWQLHFGDLLPDARIAFRLAGPSDAPVVAVLGAFPRTASYAARRAGGPSSWVPGTE